MIKELIETYPSVSLYKKTRNIKKNKENKKQITSNIHKKQQKFIQCDKIKHVAEAHG